MSMSGSGYEDTNTSVTVNGFSGTTTSPTYVGSTIVSGYVINNPPSTPYVVPGQSFLSSAKNIPFSIAPNENVNLAVGNGVSVTLQSMQGLTNAAGLTTIPFNNYYNLPNSINTPVQLTNTLVNTALNEIGASTTASNIRYLVASDFNVNNASSATMMLYNLPQKKGEVDFVNFTANNSIKGGYLDVGSYKGVLLVSGPVNVGFIGPDTEVIDAGNGATLNTTPSGASIIIAQGGSTINGDIGLDRVILPQTNSSAARVTIVSGSVDNNQSLKVQIDMPGQAPTTLTGVERIQFADGVLALDTTSNGPVAQAYRFYSALGFDRKPDPKGFGYWIHELDADQSLQGLNNVANSILHSDEFTNKFGSVDKMESGVFINLLFKNVLNRSPSPNELLFFQYKMDHGLLSSSQVLNFFTSSPEAISITGSALANGIFYTPYHP